MTNQNLMNWPTSKIGELCDLINGRAFKPNEWTKEGLPIIRIQNLNNPDASFNHFSGELADKHLINNGDLLFAWSGTPGTSFGAHVWSGETAALNQHIFKISFNENLIDKRFLRYAINQTLDELISGAHGGVGLRHVTKGKFEATEVSFPALAEQEVIADKLDALLAQVETTKARLERIPQILKRFRQSVLTAAVSGKLTEAWRNNLSLLEWDEVLLGELIIGSTNGLSKRKGESGADTTILRLADFKDARRFYGNERKIKLDSKELQKYSLQDGDILVIRVNGSIDLSGRFIEYRSKGEVEGFCDHFIRLRMDKMRILPTYLTFVANEGEGRHYLQTSLSTSAGQNTINQGSVKGLSVPLPSLTEQTEIVRRVEQLFVYADIIEKQVNNALARFNNLTKSILAKAFRGELTADWRAANPDLISGENSAEALLAAIQQERKAQREALKKQPETRKAGVKKRTGEGMSKQIIKVLDALKTAGKPLSGQQLLAAAGYPSDSSTEQLERFFLDIRDALGDKQIVKQTRDKSGQDWFALAEAQ